MFEIRFHYHPRSKVAEWQTLVFIGVVLRTTWARSQAGKQGSKSHVSSNRLLSSSFHRVYLSSVLDQAFRGLPSDLEVALGSSVVLPCQARETRITMWGDNRQIEKIQRSNFNITVQAPRGAPTPSVSWFQDGKLVKEGPGKKIEVIFQN